MSLPLFSGLTQEEIDRFVRETAAKVKGYAKGERVLEAFVKNSNIGILISGAAQIISLDRFGNESIGHTLRRGAIFGVTSSVLGETALTASVELTADSVVMWIPYRALLVTSPKLGKIHGIVMKNFLETFCYKNILMLQKIELLSQKTLRERVIVYLIQREKLQHSEKVQVPGRVQFAKELECHRSSLTREIAQMQSEGLIECGKNWMRLNKDKII